MEFKVKIDVLKDESDKLVQEMHEANMDMEALHRAQRELKEAFLILRALVQ
jgi:FtsZ-binding cell division protein ZapB